MEVVAEAADGREGIEQFLKYLPDVTLMDLRMADMGGTEAIVAIRKKVPDARIVVLTTYGGDAEVVRALQAGARGYLLKNTVHNELLETIRAVHAGRKMMSPSVAAELAEHQGEDALTPSEIEVLRFDCQRARKQGDWCPPSSYGGSREEPGEQHSLKAARERPNSRRNDRTQARNYQSVISLERAKPATRLRFPHQS
jgi:CheY-like chemotaxis protein